AFASDGSAESIAAGLYQLLSGGAFCYGQSGIPVLMGLYADELTDPGILAFAYTTNQAFYKDSLNIQTDANLYFWLPLYTRVYTCNSIIQGLSGSSPVSLAIRRQLLGEAKCVRGYLYFHGVNLYGDLPLALTTDPAVNNSLARSSQATVMQQVVQD